MEIKVFQIKPDKQLEKSDWAAFIHRPDDSDLFYWIEIEDPDKTSLKELLSPLKLNPLVLERCLDPESVSGVLPYDKLVLIQIPVPPDLNVPLPSKLAIICLPRAIITIKPHPQPEQESIAQELMAMLGRHPVSTTSFLYLILDRLVDKSTELTFLARQAVDALEAQVNAGNGNDDIGTRILELKSTVAHLEIGLELQHRSIVALLPLETKSLQISELHDYFHDVVSRLEHSLRYVERMEDHLSELHQYYLLKLQDKASNRLRVLTILSAVFMPLTLIAGIYGMNFSYMPELGWHYAYPVMLFIMLALAMGLLWYFYRKGWFR